MTDGGSELSVLRTDLRTGWRQAPSGWSAPARDRLTVPYSSRSETDRGRTACEQKMIAFIGLSQRRCMKKSATSEAFDRSDQHSDDHVCHAAAPVDRRGDDRDDGQDKQRRQARLA